MLMAEVLPVFDLAKWPAPNCQSMHTVLVDEVARNTMNIQEHSNRLRSRKNQTRNRILETSRKLLSHLVSIAGSERRPEVATTPTWDGDAEDDLIVPGPTPGYSVLKVA